jgi:DNA-binding transcriptional ArsR family regulator
VLSALQRHRFAALGSDIRQDILVALRERSHTHPELVQRLGRVTKLDYHLRQLQRCGLVRKVIMGPHEVYYDLNGEALRDMARSALALTPDEEERAAP